MCIETKDKLWRLYIQGLPLECHNTRTQNITLVLYPTTKCVHTTIEYRIVENFGKGLNLAIWGKTPTALLHMYIVYAMEKQTEHIVPDNMSKDFSWSLEP